MPEAGIDDHAGGHVLVAEDNAINQLVALRLLEEARAAFERLMASGKRGKVVIEVSDHG